jgi:putative aldouronate transport system permease protein
MGQLVLNSIFILVTIIYIVPFAMVISVSLTEETALYQGGYHLIPQKINTLAYELVFRNPGQMIRAYIVTIIFTLIATLLSTIVMALLAYPLARPNFLWRNQLNFLVYFTMLFSGGMVPSYLLITNVLHLNDTIWVYILPGLVSAYNVMIIRTNYRSIPDELIEAAKIDGAKELYICFKIMIPLAKPGLASVAFLFLVAKWNDWMTSMLYIRNPELYSLQYLLQRFLREVDYLRNAANVGSLDASVQPPTETLRFAMALVAAGPVLIIFPFFQKYFTKGMTLGGVKG